MGFCVPAPPKSEFPSAKGKTLVDDELTVSTDVLGAVERAIGSSSAAATATLVPYFSASIGGESTAVDGLSLDLSRALLAGIDYEEVVQTLEREGVEKFAKSFRDLFSDLESKRDELAGAKA